MSLSLLTPYNWVWNGLELSTTAFAVLSLVCAGWTEITSEIFCPIFFYNSAIIRNTLSFHKLPNIHFCQHFLQISHNLRTINDHINISGEKNKEVEHSRKTVSSNEKETYILTRLSDNLTTVLKLEHHAGVKNEQMSDESSLQQL